MSSTFGKPSYTKLRTTTGTMESCYKFAVITSDPLSEPIEIKPSPATPESQLMTTIQEKKDWLVKFITAFLQTTEQYFTKKYTTHTKLVLL